MIDFDHTIGYFKQFIYIVNIVETQYTRKLDTREYFILINRYHHIFRPKIFQLFDMIIHHKKDHQFDLFVLYTNNNNKPFVSTIIQYIEYYLKLHSLFDKCIFNQTHTKSFDHLVMTLSTEVSYDTIYCFIDNKKHKYMKNANLHYIHCEKYMFEYTVKDIIHQFPFHEFPNIENQILIDYFNVINRNKEKKQKSNSTKKTAILPRSSFIPSSIQMYSFIIDFLQH